MFSQVVEKAKLENGGELPINNDIVLSSVGHSPDFSKAYIDTYIKGVKQFKNTTRLELKNKSKDAHFMLLSYTTDASSPMCIPNGLCYWIIGAIHSEIPDCLYIAVDLNGIKKPNIAGRDIFVFELELNPQKNAVVKLTFPDNDWSYDLLKKSCTNKNPSRPGTGQLYYNGLDCSTIIVRDSWQISENYDW